LFAERLIEKKIHLENAIPEGLMLNSDKPMLQTVLRNLLSNAIKFTRPGGRIDLGYREEKDWDIIVVADTGTGMSPAIIKTLFTNATVSMAGTQNEAGTGLGLSICKEFLAKAGGFLTVSSEEGKGSVISVLLRKEGKPNGKMPPNFS
jgi:signal transduction histidine kinase